jgi:hypothetical protein
VRRNFLALFAFGFILGNYCWSDSKEARKLLRIESAMSSIANDSRSHRLALGIPTLVVGSAGALIGYLAAGSSFSSPPLAIGVAGTVVALEGLLILSLPSSAEQGAQNFLVGASQNRVSDGLRLEDGEIKLQRLAEVSRRRRLVLGSILTGVGAGSMLVTPLLGFSSGKELPIAFLSFGAIHLLMGLSELLISSSAESELERYNVWNETAKVSYRFDVAPTVNGLNAFFKVSF